MTTKTILKSYFEDGDVPTGAQFANLIDFVGTSGVDSFVQDNSGNWSSMYTTISTNSASWITNNSTIEFTGQTISQTVTSTGMFMTLMVNGSSLAIPLYTWE